MKWTRASEDNLPKGEGKWLTIWFNEDNEIDIHTDYLDQYEIEHISKLKGVTIIKYLDESPESSVWPGEGEIREEFGKEVQRTWEGYPHFLKLDYLNAGIEGINWVKQWLQSRTAVKAEVPHISAEEMLSETINKSFNLPDKSGINQFAQFNMVVDPSPQWRTILKAMEEYADQFKQSQPTAGGVKEEGFNPEKQASIISLAQSMFQPSPSNPSIKRPTEEEIKKALSNWILESVHPSDGPASAIAWREAINWLLSIQSDKL